MFEAGAVVYKVVADTQGAIKGFQQVEQSAGKMSSKMSKVGAAVSKALRFATPIAAVATAAVAAASAVTAFAVSIAKAERELEKMARRSKVSANQFRALEYAMKSVGVTGEKFSDISKDISDRMGEFLTAETGPFQDFVDVMGLAKGEAINLANELSRMPAEEAIGTMVKMMEDAGKSTEQMVFVMESLSGEASDLIPLYINGAKGVNRLKGEFNKLNGEMDLTADQKKNLEDLNRQYDLMKSAIGSASRALGASLAPAAESVIGYALEKIPELIQWFDKVSDRFANLIDSGLVGAQIDAFIGPWKGVLDELLGVIAKVSEYFSLAMTTIYEENKATFDSMFEGASSFATSAAKLFFSLPTYLSTALKIMSAYLEAWVKKAKTIFSVDWGKSLFDGFTQNAKALVGGDSGIDQEAWKTGNFKTGKSNPASEAAKDIAKVNSEISKIDMELKDSVDSILSNMDKGLENTERNLQKVIEAKEKLNLLNKQSEAEASAGPASKPKPAEITATEGTETAPFRRSETAVEKEERKKLVETTESVKLRSRMATETPAQRIEREEAEALIALNKAFENTMAASEANGRTIAELKLKQAEDLAMIEKAGETQRKDEINEHYNAIIEGLTAHEEAKTAIMQEAAEERKRVAFEENQAMLESYSQLASGLSGAFGDIAGAMEKSEGKQSGSYKAMFALSKGFAVAQAGLNFSLALAQALADPSALTLPQKIANYALVASSFGSLISSISGASYGGGRKMGGPVSAGKYYQVNETGVPEVYSAGGQDFLMGTRNASITPLNKMGGLGGGGNVTINNNVGAEVISQRTDDGWIFDLVRKEVDRGIEVAHDRVSRDFAKNNGKAFNALRSGTNVQGKPGVK